MGLEGQMYFYPHIQLRCGWRTALKGRWMIRHLRWRALKGPNVYDPFKFFSCIWEQTKILNLKCPSVRRLVPVRLSVRHWGGVASSAGNSMVLRFSRCRRWNRGCRESRRNWSRKMKKPAGESTSTSTWVHSDRVRGQVSAYWAGPGCR